MKKNLLLVVFFGIFAGLGCAPTKIATRKIDKAVSITSPHFVIGHVVSKYNVAVNKKDTIYVKESIEKVDTFISVNEIVNRDTIYIEKQINNATVRIVKIRDTLKVGAECRIDTVVVERHYDYTKIAEEYNKIMQDRIRRDCGTGSKMKFFIYGTLIGILIVIILRVLDRFS